MIKLGSDSAGRVAVMGGAGLVGSHIARRFLEKGFEVVVVDNLMSGSLENLGQIPAARTLEFIRCDASKPERYQARLRGCEMVFHCMSNRKGTGDENISATRGLLKALEDASPNSIFVRSTALLYGNAFRIPTPEDYSPLRPTTSFARSKLETEEAMKEFAERTGCRIAVGRIANVVGGRSFHGVVRDIVERLVNDPTRLRVLGDGNQIRSYVHIDDCVSAVELLAYDQRARGTFNIGAKDALSMFGVAELVAGELGLKAPTYVSSGAYPSGGAWPGDPRIAFPDSSKLTALGWRCSLSSGEAVKKGAREVLAQVVPGGTAAKDLSSHWTKLGKGTERSSEQPPP